MALGKYYFNYDYNKLIGRIIYKCGTREEFADRIGISNQSLVNKLSGKSGWRMNEIEDALNILDISRKDIPEYFFTPNY